MSGPAVSGSGELAAPTPATRAPAAGVLARLRRRLLENPVFARQLLVALSPVKLALVFLVANAALLVTLIVTIHSGTEDPWFERRIEVAGLGNVLAMFFHWITYAVLGFFLPLQAARLFDGHRRDGVFDQVVVTGVRPLRLHLGNWASSMSLALLIVLLTLPYHAFAIVSGGASAAEAARGLGLNLIYANVIVLMTMALGTAAGEVMAGLAAIVFFGVLGMLSISPLPAALCAWTPLRLFIAPVNEGFLAPGPFMGPPLLFGETFPLPLFAAACWGLIVLFALIYLVLGPSHVFAAGLNNFGNVVLPGDRSRMRLRTLRPALHRRVEMAFLYQNRGRFWKAWDWPLRSAAGLLAVGVWWCIAIGVAFGPFLLSGGPSQWSSFQGYALAMGTVGLIFAPIARLEGRHGARQRVAVGPWRIPAGVLSLAYYLAVVAGFLAGIYLPLSIGLEATIDRFARVPQASAEVMDLRRLLSGLGERVGIVLLFGTVLYLLGRFAARAFILPGSARSLTFVAALVLLFVPMAVIALYEERVIESPGYARLAFISPIPALIESFDPTVFQRSRVGRPWMSWSGRDAYWAIHGCLAAALASWLAVLELRGSRAGRPGGRKSGPPAPVKTAAAAALVLGMVLVGRSGAAAADDLSVEAIRGFGGQAFSDRVEHITAVLTRPDPSVTGDRSPRAVQLRLEGLDGRTVFGPVTVEAPAGTRTPFRLAVPIAGPGAPWSAQELRLAARCGDLLRTAELQPTVTPPPENLRILMIRDDGRPPPAVPSGQSWVGCPPLALPERVDPYQGCDAVIVGSTDLGTWTAPQRTALLDFARLGGTVVFAADLDARSLSSAPEWAEVLDLEDARGVEDAGAAPRAFRRLRGGRTLWNDRASGAPVLQVRNVGPGLVGWLSVDPTSRQAAEAFGGAERFLRRLAAAVPTGFGPGPSNLGSAGLDRSQGGRTLLAVAGWFAAFALALGPVVFYLFRPRRRRLWVWAYAPAASVLFALGTPLAFSTLLAYPSAAREVSITFLGAEGDEGVRHSYLWVASAGRRDHRLSIAGTDASAFAREGMRGWNPYGADEDSLLKPLGSGWGRDSLAIPAFTVPPWGMKGALAVAGERRAVGVSGRAVADVDMGGFQVEVTGLPRGKAWVVIYSPAKALGKKPAVAASGAARKGRRKVPAADPEEKAAEDAFPNGGPIVLQGNQLVLAPGASRESVLHEDITSWINPLGPARGTVAAGARTGGLPDFIERRREGAPRAFVVWADADAPATFASDDLVFDSPRGRVAYTMRELELEIPEGVADRPIEEE